MCGFAGFIDFNRSMSKKYLNAYAKKLNEYIKYRGPDSHGEWTDENLGVAIGHRRLSIIDLSKEGNQPMVSSTGRYVISYNGEIYNFEKIKKKLSINKSNLRGHSDTEIILESIEEYGLITALEKFNGMFSFALWDRKEEMLFLVRDRIGIKPLYYSHNKNHFIFASELKPIIKSGFINKDIDIESLGAFFKYNYIPAPKTIFNGVYKLSPGTILSFSLNKKTINIQKYWDAGEICNQSIKKTYDSTEIDTKNRLRAHIDNSVSNRMISDVPLGVFLSGGVDSSLIAATMQKFNKTPIRSFSIGFGNDKYNEAIDAKKVADYIGADHTEMYVTEQDALNVIPNLAQIWDEPFADSSQIPTFLLSKMTRDHVTVALSGDGGDELFSGYSRYQIANKLWNNINKFPYVFRNFSSKILFNLPPALIDNSYKAISPLLSEELKFTHKPSSKINSIASILSQKNQSGVYDQIIDPWQNINPVSFKAETLNLHNYPGKNFIEKMMAYDFANYLPDDILTKVDRASMANSLETRVPLLDHKLVEFIWELPHKYKVNEGKSKWILKQLLYEYLPKDIIDRPKKGFAVPLASWLRGTLRDWTKDLLNKNQLNKHNLLDASLIESILNKHLNNEGDFHPYLWKVLMFQSWYDEWMG